MYPNQDDDYGGEEFDPEDLIIGSTLHKYKIEKRLGRGCFGVVYLASNDTGKYALKIATTSTEEATTSIINEINVLKSLKRQNAQHCCQFQADDTFKGYRYLVMSLVGPSLEDILRNYPPNNRKFSLGTAISVAKKCLQAIEELHRFGFIHKDIKPGNFAIGQGSATELRKIYLLDFGLCQKFDLKDAAAFDPNAYAPYCATADYTCIASHLEQAHCYFSDIESFVYMVVDMTTGTLPWKGFEDNESIKVTKQLMVDAPDKLFVGCPDAYKTIYCNGFLKPNNSSSSSFPNYPLYYQALESSLSKVQEYPYDWELNPSLLASS